MTSNNIDTANGGVEEAVAALTDDKRLKTCGVWSGAGMTEGCPRVT